MTWMVHPITLISPLSHPAELEIPSQPQWLTILLIATSSSQTISDLTAGNFIAALVSNDIQLGITNNNYFISVQSSYS